MKKIPVLILTGPTAVGKTELSIKLAKAMNAEIISADSMQIYRYMDIGSAKVTEEEMEGVVHHMIDIVDPDEEFSVSEFKRLAEKTAKDIYNRGKNVIITGGTGLYLNSIIYDMDFAGTCGDSELRDILTKELAEKGSDYMYEKLKSLSPEAALRIHPNNTVRVIRAIEVCMSGGEMKDFSRDLKPNPEFDIKTVVLIRDRDVLYERINRRVDIMMERGLLKEVEKLREMGYTKDMVSMKGIGYKEILEYLDSAITLEEAVNMIKQGSRRYAKRQLTWFRKYTDACVIDVGEITNVQTQIEIIKEYIQGGKQC